MKQFVIPFLLAVTLASSAEAGPTVFIVRHAEKKQTSAVEKDPGLSDAGRQRADRLAAILKGAKITAIFATEFKRTQMTAGPLARALSLQVTTLNAGNPDGLLQALRTASGNVLVVGHSNTIPILIRALGISVPIEISENDYDHLFAVTLGDKPHLVHSRY